MVVLVLPEVNLLDLAGPVQVLHAAGRYRITYVADAPERLSAQGLLLAGLGPLTPAGSGDLILIPGPDLHPPEPGQPLVAPRVVRWLREAYERGAAVAAVCSGAAALAEAGLLDGRRCTTHWGLTGLLRQHYPAARVQDGVLYVHDGRISTSAGISAGIDLALSLVERDHGPELTAAVARQLVVYLRRAGSGAQISPYLEHRAHLNPAVHRVQEHIAQHLDGRHTLADLARVANLSPRGLSRAFRTTIGMTPLEYQQGLRMEHATALLTGTDLTVEAVAARCGFTDARHFRRVYTARFGAPPSASRPAVTHG